MASKKKSGHAGTPALNVLEKSGVEFKVYEYEHSTHMDKGYALDTASVLGISPNAVFKTLMVESGRDSFVGVVPASSRLNLKALAKLAGVKSVAMMDPQQAEKLTGYVTGGISPLGQKKRSPIFLDASALELDMILVSGGKRDIPVGIAPADLVTVCDAVVGPIAE